MTLNVRDMPRDVDQFGVADFSPEDERDAMIDLRNRLRLQGNPSWTAPDAELKRKFHPRATSSVVAPQPEKRNIREISEGDIVSILRTRERFPNYRMDVTISPEVIGRINQRQSRELINSQQYYGRQPFTIMRPDNGIRYPISSRLALDALTKGKQVIRLPVTEFSNTNEAMNTTTFSESMNRLDAFSAFSCGSNVRSMGASAGSGGLTGLLGTLTNAGTGVADIYGKIKGADSAESIAKRSLAAQTAESEANRALALALANRPAEKTNWMPIAIIGGVILIGGIALMAKK